MNNFNDRGLEIHEAMWDEDQINKALKFMVEHDMNILILHKGDIIDKLIYPCKYFGYEDKTTNIHHGYSKIFRKLYQYTPAGRSAPYTLMEFMKRVLTRAKRSGIKVYLNNKEIWFPDVLLNFHPELYKNGFICPSEPFWEEFIHTKYEELFNCLPDLAGIITSPATGESKVSISGNHCKCEKCQKMNPSEWYYNILMAMYKPIKKAGKELVVRDFVFDSSSQAEISTSMEEIPDDIKICFKNTPHDYYPTFPNNPRIGTVRGHKQWVEFDAMGQYYGWGVAPSIMLDDLKARMRYALDKGVTGYLVRIDWETLPDHSCFDTPNLLNLYGAAELGKDVNTSNRDIYYQWLENEDMLAENLSALELKETLDFIQSTLGQTWDIVSKSLYTNDCVFSDSSTFPVSLDHAWWLAEEKNSLRDWDPDKEDALYPTKENIQKILVEKDEAWEKFEEINTRVKGKNPGLKDEVYSDLLTRFNIFGLCVKGFTMIGKISILARNLLEGRLEGRDEKLDLDYPPKQLLDKILDEMTLYKKELQKFNEETDYHHAVYHILNPERLESFLTDVRSKFGNVN